MYNRIAVVMLKVLSSLIAVGSELMSFYYLFLQFENILTGSGISHIVQHDIIFFAIITAASVLVHELVEMIIDLGDRLETRGERIWKNGTRRHQSYS